jgi:hypothetical protein
MTQGPTGGCQCGAVRYRIVGKPLELVVCHCTECQRQSGSAFGMSLVLPLRQLEILAGQVKFFEVRADSGRTKSCAFCPECGTRLYHRKGDTISVKAGTLDDTSALKPSAHYWTKRKQPWVQIPDGVRCFEDDG